MHFKSIVLSSLAVASQALKDAEIFDHLRTLCELPVQEGYEEAHAEACDKELSVHEAIEVLTPRAVVNGYELEKTNVTAKEDIINAGKQIWGFIEKNEPVVDYKSDWASAVPSNCIDWTCLGSWKDQKSKEFEFKWKVGFRTVSQMTYKFSWNYEGTESPPRGLYVENAGTQLIEIQGDVGQEVSSWVEARNPINYGTPEEPMGGIDIQVFFKSASPFSDSVISCTNTLMGDGNSKLGVCTQTLD